MLCFRFRMLSDHGAAVLLHTFSSMALYPPLLPVIPFAFLETTLILKNAFADRIPFLKCWNRWKIKRLLMSTLTRTYTVVWPGAGKRLSVKPWTPKFQQEILTPTTFNCMSTSYCHSECFIRSIWHQLHHNASAKLQQCWDKEFHCFTPIMTTQMNWNDCPTEYHCYRYHHCHYRHSNYR